MDHKGNAARLQQGDVGNAAREVGIETAALLAFLEVEAAGRGFDSRGRLKLLTEAHIFYKYLPANMRAAAVDAGLAWPKWRAGAYNFDVYARFNAMISFQSWAAFMSASYGLGQIMGFNHNDAGHRTAREMYDYAKRGEREQLTQLVRLMKAWGIADSIRGRDLTVADNWRAAAKRYNGSGYATHGYHTKMAKAYIKHSGQLHSPVINTSPILRFGNKGEAVRALQTDLQTLGYKFASGIDGRFGAETRRHVVSFQTMRDLVPDGFVGKETQAAIALALQSIKTDHSPDAPAFDKRGGLAVAIIAAALAVFYLARERFKKWRKR